MTDPRAINEHLCLAAMGYEKSPRSRAFFERDENDFDAVYHFDFDPYHKIEQAIKCATTARVKGLISDWSLCSWDDKFRAEAVNKGRIKIFISRDPAAALSTVLDRAIV